MKVLNFNVGLLGHVDSGKTSLAKVLSSVSSTAAFDKDPQSQERGITLDLGFSSFSSPVPAHLSDSKFDVVQFTLVDCPGHASLIKTIIGGSQIIDLMILVIDVTKGFQTQTSECLIIGEITKKKLIVVLNKVDQLADKIALEKLTKRVRITMDNTIFKGCPIVPASALNNDIKELTEALEKATFIPERNAEKPFLFAVDHCFALKGKGTILTGTVLQGKAKLNDDIELPSIALIKKIKSIEVFRKPVETLVQGDRAGICVTQFDPKTLERGLACQVNYLPKVYAAIIDFNKVKYYKDTSNTIDTEKEYMYIPEYDEAVDTDSSKLYALIEFSKPVLIAPNNLTIGARLDTPVNSNSCRLAFHGNVLLYTALKNYAPTFLSGLKIYKEKYKKGTIDRIVNEYSLIGKNMFKKESNIDKFLGMKISLSSGETGVIESTFGLSGKFKVQIPDGLKETTMGKSADKNTIEIILKYKRYIYDPNKKMVQT
ncbi:hypothetical protein RUM43_004909 [Polyplax serrata]|uniref:Tr-type G domain-containing protein n=1 Tax=Polyplax serrata TaxID=468196 RepID=A0AAN8XM78_POLSC